MLFHLQIRTEPVSDVRSAFLRFRKQTCAVSSRETSQAEYGHLHPVSYSVAPQSVNVAQETPSDHQGR